MKPVDLSIVVPVYNSEATIGTLVKEMSEEFEGKYEYDFVLINDGSQDRSYEVCKKMALENRRVKFISLSKNFGQINAIMAGFHEANGRIIIVMDDDLQNPPKEAYKLLKKINEGYDFVYGKPKIHMKQTWFRKVASYLSTKMAEIVFAKPKGLYPSSYYAITQDVVKEIIKYTGPFPYMTGLVVRVTRNGCNVPVEHHSRRYGKSGYSPGKLFLHLLNGLTNFSVLPLRISSVAGAVVAIIGFIYLAVIVAQRLLNPEIYTLGWTSVIGLIMLFSGIQLLALGIIGEYVGRIFLVVNKTPQFSIRETFNCTKISRGKGDRV